MKPGLLALWGMPVLLGVLTLTGLVCALLGDGRWDYISAVALAAPVLAAAWFGLRRNTPPQSAHRQ